jgi:hypothetical protein
MGFFDKIGSMASSFLDKAKQGAGFLNKVQGYGSKAMKFINSDGVKSAVGMASKYIPGVKNLHDTVNKYGQMGMGGLNTFSKQANEGLRNAKNMMGKVGLTQNDEPPERQQRTRGRRTMERQPRPAMDENEGGLFS